jgi:toxin YoeB
MAKNIVWTASARQDRFDILTYWINRTKSNRYSIKLNEVFINHAEILSKHPFLGKQTELENIRCLPFGNYSLFYQIDKNHIIIH